MPTELGSPPAAGVRTAYRSWSGRRPAPGRLASIHRWALRCCACRNAKKPFWAGSLGLATEPNHSTQEGIFKVRLFHTLGRTSVAFDDPNLVSAGGLVPLMALADRAGLRDLADEHLTVPTDKGANAGLKIASLVAGMVAGADSIDDMALLRHGGMSQLFLKTYAPSTLGSFLRSFTFGHVRQLDAVASRFLIAIAGLTPLLGAATTVDSDKVEYALLDVDETIIEVHGYAKQGAGFGYTKVRGLNALLATLATPTTAPVIVAQRLRKGSAGSPRGAKRLVGDTVWTTRRILGKARPVLVRMDSAFYGRGPVHAALKGGAAVSVTARMDPAVKRRSPASMTTRGQRSSTPTPSSTKRQARGSLGPRSPKCRSPRSPRPRRPSGSRAA